MDRTIHSHNFYLAMILQRHCLAVRLNGAKDNTIWSWINIAVMLLDRLKMWHPYYAYLTFISAIFLPISLYKWTASWHLLCSSFELWYVSEVKLSLHGTMRNQTSFAPNGKHIYNELFPIPYVVHHTEKSNSVNKWLISATTSMSVYSLGGIWLDKVWREAKVQSDVIKIIDPHWWKWETIILECLYLIHFIYSAAGKFVNPLEFISEIRFPHKSWK